MALLIAKRGAANTREGLAAPRGLMEKKTVLRLEPSSRLELAHLLGQHPKPAIQRDTLVDALDRAGPGTLAFGIAAFQPATHQVVG